MFLRREEDRRGEGVDVVEEVASWNSSSSSSTSCSSSSREEASRRLRSNKITDCFFAMVQVFFIFASI